MEGGIAILLLVVVALAAVWAFGAGGIGGALGAAKRKGEGDEPRPLHRVAEPEDDHSAGYGVGGEHGSTPRPARVDS